MKAFIEIVTTDGVFMILNVDKIISITRDMMDGSPYIQIGKRTIEVEGSYVELMSLLEKATARPVITLREE